MLSLSKHQSKFKYCKKFPAISSYKAANCKEQLEVGKYLKINSGLLKIQRQTCVLKPAIADDDDWLVIFTDVVSRNIKVGGVPDVGGVSAAIEISENMKEGMLYTHGYNLCHVPMAACMSD